MSEYSKVYGHCDAGCKRQVVSFEEFRSSATFIVENTDAEGRFVLEQGRTYKISNSNDTDSWGFRILVTPKMKKGSYMATPITWWLTLPAYDKYDNYIKFRWLELILEPVSGTQYNINLVCETNGVRQTVTYGSTVSLSEYDISTLNTEVRVYDATNCWVFNEDAEVVGGNGEGTGEGTPGKDGISPTIEIVDIAGGHRLNITDKNGTQAVDIMDGSDGDDGRGIVSIKRTNGTGAAGTTDTYTITYTDGTSSTFAVYNGKNGTSITITDTIETDDDSERGVLFSDGTTLYIRNGATAEQVVDAMSKETWTFTLEDGTTVTKVVPLV